MKEKLGFVRGRIKSVGYAIKGAYLLLTTEDSIKAHIFFATLSIVLGVFFQISKAEWMFQILAIGIVLSTESLNTAVEKLCDFMQPHQNVKIGFIKDISAGAVTFSVFAASCVLCFIYVPYFLKLL